MTGRGAVVGDALVRDARVGGITFTGSTIVGTQIYEAAARRLARVQLELGGKNPAVVVDCTDLDDAAREIVGAGVSVQRPAVHGDQPGDRRRGAGRPPGERILAHVARIKVGDGLDPWTTMGPLVSQDQLRTVDGYVRRRRFGMRSSDGRPGADRDPERQGFYYAPTVFDRVPPDSPLAVEEIFGPVLPILRVRDLDEAITIANSTRYGLAASLFTSHGSIQEFTRGCRRA